MPERPCKGGLYGRCNVLICNARSIDELTERTRVYAPKLREQV